jgi:hypothetical protein
VSSAPGSSLPQNNGKSTSSAAPLQFNFAAGASSADSRKLTSSVALTSKNQSFPSVKPRAVTRKNANNKSSFSTVIAIASIFVTIAVVGVFVAAAISTFQNYTSKTKAAKIADLPQITTSSRIANAYTDDELSAIAAQENAALPKMIDHTTRLDSAIGVANEMQYNASLIDLNFESVAWTSLKNTLEISLINWVCTTRHIVEVFISKGVIVSFAYFGQDKRLIGVISVQPSRCASVSRSSEL